MDMRPHIEQHPVFRLVADSAQNLDIEAYVVGGYVRDLLLKRKKQKQDLDFVCVGSGIELAQKVAQLSQKNPQVHSFQRFGTAMIRLFDLDLEFVGARKESYNQDSRKPVVEDGTLQDDQNRRDFTINSLAISLNAKDYGQLLDPFDGVRDLQRKLIKTPLSPNQTFSDDPLRMMRAIRFASELNFDIEARTFESIQQNKERIKIISQERITDELNKIILSPVPSYGFKLLFHSGLLPIIFPEFCELLGAEVQDGKSHKDNFYHTLQVLDNLSKYSHDLWLRWAAILHDIAKPQTKRFDKKVGWTFHGHEEKGAKMVPFIFRKMRLPLNEKMRFVQKLVRLHLRPIALVKETITDSAIRRLVVEAGDDVEALMMLCRADITSKDHNRVARYLQNFDKVEQKILDVGEKDRLRNFKPVIDGEHIMEIFNLKPCPVVGQIKLAVREAILEGLISNEWEAALAFTLKVGEKNGLKIVNKISKPISTPQENELED
ncbi:MAG: HD domain-containing protein [Cytophagales bacterium]|nr:MAG: HD domain-containing protein [Cytophagales bacterium]TAF59496.1 MAG: HD domain-containing protein [Cytophagales bacterium]